MYIFYVFFAFFLSVQTQLLKDRLMSMWNDLEESERAKYSKMEAEDKARYEKEMTRYVAMGGDASTSAM